MTKLYLEPSENASGFFVFLFILPFSQIRITVFGYISHKMLPHFPKTIRWQAFESALSRNPFRELICCRAA